MPTAESLTVLHVSPHPDDEAIAAPATLLAMKAAGHRVLNLLVSLGRPEDADRRRAEAEEAEKRLGFELRVHDPPLRLSRGEGLAADEERLAADEALLTKTLDALNDSEGVDIVVAPGPHDAHPAHEAVGRVVRGAIANRRLEVRRWWMWGLWGELPCPTLYVPFNDIRLTEVLFGLGAYVGELDRNNYGALVRGRARANRPLGSERVFGFGCAQQQGPYAELLTELVFSDGCWLAAPPRVLDPDNALPALEAQQDLTWWMTAESFGDRLRKA
jgi:hypothetical protein